MASSEKTCSPLVFQQAIRQWCGRFLAEFPTRVVLASQGEVDKLAQWSLAGGGVRQEVLLQGETLCWRQPNGRVTEIPVSPHPSTPDGSLVWQTLQRALHVCRHHNLAGGMPFASPFSGGLVGLTSYEASPYCDSALHVPSGETSFPTFHWIECERWVVWCHATQAIALLGDWPPEAADAWHALVKSALQSAKLKVSQVQQLETPDLSSLLADWQASFSPQVFVQQVENLKTAIHAGEFYQANLSLCLQHTTQHPPWALFEAVSAQNPSPFAAYWHMPGYTVVSNSPERLVDLKRSHANRLHVSARPIAGTRGRGNTAAQDVALSQELAENTKEQAEHLMLVDLLRNDVGRVSHPGTVNVDELMVLERYSHVTHLVSNVVGELQADKTWIDVVQAVFPGGTITGCPKVRCCQYLAQAEPVARGFYTGSLGYVDAATGQMDLNILIRSVGLVPMANRAGNSPEWQALLHVGAGIVADSAPEHEYNECLKKAMAWLSVFNAI